MICAKLDPPVLLSGTGKKKRYIPGLHGKSLFSQFLVLVQETCFPVTYYNSEGTSAFCREYGKHFEK
jgi:hypothetical protein